MASSDGTITIDTNIDTTGIESSSPKIKASLLSIGNVAKKVGGMIAAAFAVKKVVDFGKECLELGSDLAEVQNVVDVTFSTMSDKVDKFAKSAAKSYGLSETMAKQYTGTFGAMAKAFGYSEAAAYDMATSLTALTGDVASFYNLSQEEAYTKLKSVFTGETESLKDLGVVMTQTALDQYALANGYGKTTSAMAEQEKVALRLAFVQEQLSLASGDFARTSDSWANQVKIMRLQLESLKATIGQGLINLFTPIIKAINLFLEKIATAANAFKAFTELLTGKKSTESAPIESSSSGLADLEQGYNSAADGAGNLADNTGDAAKATDKQTKATKQATKAANKYLSPLDEINRYTKENAAGGITPAVGAGAAGAGTAITGAVVDFGKVAEGETEIDKMDSKLQGLINRCEELARLLKKGFKIGFGDSKKRIDEIKDHIQGIGASLKEIWTDPQVLTAANGLLDAIALNLGKAAGAMASVGVTIADNLIGGVDKYLLGSKEYIKERLVNIFDANTRILDLFGALCSDIADIFSVFANDDGKRITASIIGVFSDGFLGLEEIASRSVAGLFAVVSGVISENKEGIKTAIENTLAPIATVAEAIHGVVRDTFAKMSEIYDEYIDPAFVRIKDGFSTVFAAALEAYNSYLAPVLSWIAERFTELTAQYIQPLLDAFLDLWGKAVEAVSMFWEFISPFVGWFVESFIAVFATKLQFLWSVFEAAFGAISSVLQGFIEACSGIIDFLVGVFTGDWDKAWNGVKEIFSGIWTAISGVASSVWAGILNVITTTTEAMKNVIDLALKAIKTIWEAIWTTCGDFLTKVWEGIKDYLPRVWETIKKNASEMWGAITGVMEKLWKGLSETATAVFGGIRDTISKIWGAVKTLSSTAWGGIKKAVEDVWNTLKTTASTVWNSIKSTVSTVWDNLASSASRVFGNIKRTISDVWDNVLSKTETVWSGIKSAVKMPINAIIGFANGLVRGMASAVNSIADMLNNLSVDIPDWVPGIGGGTLGFNLPKWTPGYIPYLASGAVIPPRSEFLAILGDQKRGNNIEAPEALLRKIVREESGGKQTGGIYQFTAQISRRTLFDEFIEEAKLRQRMTGENPLDLNPT